jgi:hypothetical protein
LGRTPAEMQRGMNTAAGNWRNESGRVADQHHAAAPQWFDGTAGGDQSAPPFDNSNRFGTRDR